MLGSSAHGWPQRYVMYTKGWAARMTTLVECWNNVGELSSWVATKVCNVHQRVGSKDDHFGGVLVD
jgi:hypothetical protein